MQQKWHQMFVFDALLLHRFGNLIACVAALFVTIVSRLLSVRAREGRA